MKRTIAMLGLSLLVFNGFSNPTPKISSSQKVEINKISKTIAVLPNSKLSRIISEVSCTMSCSAQMPGVGCVQLSVTAPTCREAATMLADFKKKIEE